MSRRYAVTGMRLLETEEGWFLFPPTATTEAIADGTMQAIAAGTGHPTGADYARAYELWQASARVIRREDSRHL